MVHSGIVGFAIRITTISIPISNPYSHRPILVCAEVTGSVAKNMMPNTNPPKTMCQNHGMENIGLVSLPIRLNSIAVKTMPINPPVIMRQEAIPV